MKNSRSQRHALIALASLLTLMACEATSATDKQKGLRELREMEAYNARYSPDIPMSERVGCEVCPGWCKYLDLSLSPLDELFRDYRKHAMTVYDLSGEIEVEGGVYAKRAIHRISCIAKRSGPAGYQALAAYLDDESLIIQVATADLMMYRDIDRPRAYRLLDHIQKTHPRIPYQPGFMASVMVMKWTAELDPLRHARQYRKALSAAKK